MRAEVVAIFIFIAVLIPVPALSYEREPSIEVVSVSYIDIQKGITSPINSNYLGKGEKILLITIYNPAVREKIRYDFIQEAMFFNSREEMLFTAYNVELELESNDAIKVKTGKITLPALPAMQSVSLQFFIEVFGENETELKFKAKYEVIDKLKTLQPYDPNLIPVRRMTTIINSTADLFNFTLQNTTEYRYDIFLKEYELEYTTKIKEIPIKLHIEEKDVLLEVKEIKTEKLIVDGKGNVEVSIKNVGKKTAKNAYATIELPKLQQATTQAISSIPTSMLPFVISTPSIGSTTSATSSQSSYFIGDLKPGEIAKASFYVTMDVPAGGVYPVKLKLVYLDEYGNLKESDPVSFGIEVISKPEVSVIEIDSRIFVNSKGEVILKMKSNIDLSDASARIVVSSPLSALSSECYLGDIKSGDEFSAIFKLKASSEAEATKYPAELYVKFRAGNEYVESDAIKIGIEVKPEIEFFVLEKAKIRAGEEAIVTFAIRNNGNAVVRDATARLIIVSPFSSTDDTAFIGDLNPGEIAKAKFKLSVDRDATPKLYALNLEVKYRAENGEWVISKPSKAIIEVEPPTANYTVYLIVLVLLLAGVVYYLRKRR
ncbi:MAG: S-layer protein [Archaeoglobaceae archaeon]|nr:S-layer protein [Archaeoglobaceae archaeon]MDW8128370.1 S-layer protein [Archaeoglobaceae archaeon]